MWLAGSFWVQVINRKHVQLPVLLLFQLQQINFMSLMQVVGASFSNLPLSQANLLQSSATAAQRQSPPGCLTQNAQHTSLPTRASGPERVNNDQDLLPVNVNCGSDLNPRNEIEQRNPARKPQVILVIRE